MITVNDALTREAFTKALAFHKKIEESNYLTELLLESECSEWHDFREAMIRLKLADELPDICPCCGRDNTGYEAGCTSDDCPGNNGGV